MLQLREAIRDLFEAQRAYDEACARNASAEDLIVFAEAMSRAIIVHGEVLRATPRSAWQAEADAAMATLSLDTTI